MEQEPLEGIESQPSLFKKIFIAIISLFLLFLFITYFFSNGIIIDYILSKSVSYSPENFIINAKKITVVFDEATLNKLNELYKTNEGKELKLCLKGEILNNAYSINDFYLPKQKRFFNEVSSEYCKETIIDLHTHPNNRCIFSNVDVLTYRRMKEENEALAIGLMCNINKFNFYKE